MIAFSYGRITRATVARNPVAKGVLLPLKLTGLGLFLFKLRLHVFKPFSFNTKSKGIQFRATSSFSSQECAIRRQGQRQAPSSAGMSRHTIHRANGIHGLSRQCNDAGARDDLGLREM